MVASTGLKSSVYTIHLHGQTYGIYAAVPALALNLVISALLSLIPKKEKEEGATSPPLQPIFR
jgi:SSS family solute:Na+ symporter